VRNEGYYTNSSYAGNYVSTEEIAVYDTRAEDIESKDGQETHVSEGIRTSEL
jgi:hypothetical protein